MSFGSLFGIIFAFSRKALPEGHDAKKALVLAAIMWFTIFLIPFLKYPANPPTVGDPDTVVLRGILFLSFIAISGFGALGFYRLSKKLQKRKKILSIIGYAAFMSIVFALMPTNPDEITAPIELVNGFRVMSLAAVSVYWVSNASKKLQKRKKILSIIGYAAFMSIVFALMPTNPDEITAPLELVNSFRVMSLVTVSLYWISNAIILGVLWQRFKPDKPIHTKTH